MLRLLLVFAALLLLIGVGWQPVMQLLLLIWIVVVMTMSVAALVGLFVALSVVMLIAGVLLLPFV